MVVKKKTVKSAKKSTIAKKAGKFDFTPNTVYTISVSKGLGEKLQWIAQDNAGAVGLTDTFILVEDLKGNGDKEVSELYKEALKTKASWLWIQN